MKIKITIPTTLADIKLSAYQKYIKLSKDSEDIAYIHRLMVGIFCNLDDKTVGQLPKRSYDNIIKTVTKVLNDKSEFKEIIYHNGKEYGFIPCLEDITVDEKADLDSTMNDVQKMHKAMAVMYRPITSQRKGKYLIEDYTGKEEPLDLTMDIVTGANVFFSSLMNDLLNCTQSYLNRVANQTQTSQILEQNGIGINQYMESLEVTFSGLRKLANYDYTRH
jgi:hypothetical protein